MNGFEDGGSSQRGYSGNQGGYNRQGGGNYPPRNQGNYQDGYNRSGNSGGQGNYPPRNQGQSQGQAEERQERPLPDPVFYRAVAVVGNREADPALLDKAKVLVKMLAKEGFVIRAGGMDGLEKSIEESAGDMLELHLPWRNFDQRDSKFSSSSPMIMSLTRHFVTAVNFEKMPLPVKGFLAKITRTILGSHANSPVLAVLVCSEDAAESPSEVTSRTGNAGHAIKVASYWRIPVFNLKNPECQQNLMQHLGLGQTKLERNPSPENGDDDSFM